MAAADERETMTQNVGAGPVDLERLAWIEVVEAAASVVDGRLRQLVVRLARLEQREVGVARAGVDGDSISSPAWSSMGWMTS
jgi:hypothetical protein